MSRINCNNFQKNEIFSKSDRINSVNNVSKQALNLKLVTIIVKQFIAFLRFRCHIGISVAIMPKMATKSAKTSNYFTIMVVIAFFSIEIITLRLPWLFQSRSINLNRHQHASPTCVINSDEIPWFQSIIQLTQSVFVLWNHTIWT